MFCVLIYICSIAYALWTTLDKSNQALARLLLSLSDVYATDPVSYTDAVKYISPLKREQVGFRFFQQFSCSNASVSTTVACGIWYVGPTVCGRCIPRGASNLRGRQIFSFVLPYDFS